MNDPHHSAIWDERRGAIEVAGSAVKREHSRAMGCRAEVASAVYPVAIHLHGAMTREKRRPATERENHGGQPFTRVTQYKVSYIIFEAK